MNKKKTKRMLMKSIQKPLPIVIVPNTSYVDDKGVVIPSDIILISDATIYTKIRMTLANATKRITNDKSK